jgi:hypothetical protein
MLSLRINSKILPAQYRTPGSMVARSLRASYQRSRDVVRDIRLLLDFLA